MRSMRTKNSHVIRKTWPWPSHMPPNRLSNLTIVVVEERDDARKTSRQKGSAILGSLSALYFRAVTPYPYWAERPENCVCNKSRSEKKPPRLAWVQVGKINVLTADDVITSSSPLLAALLCWANPE
jgi:hypothetical protein